MTMIAITAHRLSIPVSVSVVILFGLIAVGRGTRTTAQEATPAAVPNLVVGQLAPIGQPFEVLPGINIAFLNEGQPAAAPGQSLVVYRITFHGGEVPAHRHPGTTVATVESGTLSWTLLQGTVWVTRPGMPPEQVTAPGTELVLKPGEGLLYNADVVHTARAAGDQPAVAIVAVLFAVGQPVLTFTNEQGTPMAMGTPAP